MKEIKRTWVQKVLNHLIVCFLREFLVLDGLTIQDRRFFSLFSVKRIKVVIVVVGAYSNCYIVFVHGQLIVIVSLSKSLQF